MPKEDAYCILKYLIVIAPITIDKITKIENIIQEASFLFIPIIKLYRIKTIKVAILVKIKNCASISKNALTKIFVSTILLIVLGASFISQYFGFSHSLGAFIAGMVIAGTDYKYKIRADIEHFKDLFLGFFFITVGMQVDVLFFLKHIVVILVLLIIVILIKMFVIYWTIRIFRQKEEAFKTALSLSQIGEFSFVVFLLASKNNIFSGEFANSIIPFIADYKISTNDLNQYLTLLVILSMVATPFILDRIKDITRFVFMDSKIDDVVNDQVQDAKDYSDYVDHIIICGYGVFGQSVASYLKDHDINYIAIDHNYAKIQDGLKNGDSVVFGNIVQSGIIEKLNIKQCAAVVIAIDNSYKIRDICKILLDKIPNCNIIAKINAKAEDNNIDDLDLYGIVDERVEIARILGQEAIVAREEKLNKG